MPIPRSIYFMFSRHFSSTPNLPKLPKIPPKFRRKAIEEAQQALTDYLHTTRSLPFPYAEHISKNSLFSVSNLIVSLDFSPTHFSKTVKRFLSYHPINEFEFFLESIGINYEEVRRFLPVNKFFFSEDGSALEAAYVLSRFGFPWNKLGKLYEVEISIFSMASAELNLRLNRLKEYGYSNVIVIGICMTFPSVLNGDGVLGGETGALLSDLKMVFVDFDLVSCVEENVNSWYEVCRKVRVFYDLGCEKGKTGELMGRGKNIFVEYSEEALVQKVEYFCRFGVKKEDVGLLILQCPEILDVNLETPVFSVLGLLKHFGLSDEELTSVSQKYPYVLGRNIMANLPHVMRALDLHHWFFSKIKNGNVHLLANYVLSDPDEDMDKEFSDSLERIQHSRTSIHTMSKLHLLQKIGFGENGLTIHVLDHVHGTSKHLEDRFGCLLRMGIEYSKLCKMVRMTPKIINQKPKTIERKVHFLCHDMGSSFQLLEVFPAFLCFDLEKRIIPRYRFHVWLSEKGLCTKNYSIASIVASSHKTFIARLLGIHPATPKFWFECFSP